MKNVNFKYCIVLIGFLSISLLGTAQHREKLSVDQKLERMNQQFELSTDQQSQMKELLIEAEQKREAYRSSGNRPSREEMQANRKEMDAKMKSILTDEQYAKMKALRKNHQHKPNRSSKSVDAQLQKMDDNLDLTPEQEQKIKVLIEQSKKEKAEIMESNTLSEDEKKDAVKELRKKKKEQMKQILTAEQLEKMKAMKREKRKY